jgi:hypothetical protein
LVLFSTPLPLDPALTGSDAAASLRSLLLLTDTAPDPAPIFSTSGRRTPDVYSLILANRAIEVRRPSDEEASALRKANHVLLRYQSLLSKIWWWYLYGSTPPVEYSQKYLTYFAFLKEDAALRTQAMREPDAARRAELLKAAAEVQKRWTAQGHKGEVERALADLRASRAKDPERFWAETASLFSGNSRLVNGSLIPFTQVLPPAGQWASESGWIAWHSGSSSGLAKSIRIDRKWMNLDVLTKHPWSWADGQFKQEGLLISDGTGLAAQKREAELMPLLPVQLLLIRNSVTAGRAMSSDSPVIAGIACRILPKLPGM